MVAVLVVGLAAAADQGENRDWPAVFREDLAAIRQIICTDHPGPVDDLNPGFVDWLDAGFVEWRMSEGNIPYWTAVPQFIRDQFGDDRQAVRWAEHAPESLRIASKKGEQLWRETPVDDGAAEPGHATDSVSAGGPVYTGTVILLTNNTCGSACRDAMSLLSPLPGVVHAGSVTSADTQYMESRPVALPSDLATIVIPIKVYRGRVRPDGGYFTPQFRFDGLHWTDEALENWLLSLWCSGAFEVSHGN